MAQSQVLFDYSPANLDALTAAFSASRLSTYLRKSNQNKEYAFALYLYNTRLAKSLLFPLSVTEITLRNAVDQCLTETYGTKWHQDSRFRRDVLTRESLQALNKAIKRATPKKNNRGQPSRGKVIAELTFDFWSNLFRREYSDLWRTKASVAFPNMKNGQGRAEIQSLAKEINEVRNRVAHHEPILDINIPDILSKMFRLTEMRCSTTVKWMRHHTTTGAVMRSKPKISGTAHQSVLDRSDPNFRIVNSQDKIIAVCDPAMQNSAAFICIDGGSITGAFTYKEIAKFISSKVHECGGLIDLNDHKVADILRQTSGIWSSIDGNTSIEQATNAFSKPSVQILISTSPGAGSPSGVLLRAHRRY